MATLTTIIADVRAAVDRDGTDVQVPDSTLTTWINQEYQALGRYLGDLVPDRYTAVSADLAISSGNALSLSSLTSFGKVVSVQRKEGADYYTLPLAPRGYPDAGAAGALAWRLRGGATVDVFPATGAPGTYRVRYVTRPALLALGSDVLDVPDGGDRVVVEAVAARCRQRWEEDPSIHLQARDRALAELRGSLAAQELATPTAVVDVTGEF